MDIEYVRVDRVRARNSCKRISTARAGFSWQWNETISSLYINGVRSKKLRGKQRAPRTLYRIAVRQKILFFLYFVAFFQSCFLPYQGTGLSVPLPLLVLASLLVAAILSPRLLLFDKLATSFNRPDIFCCM